MDTSIQILLTRIGLLSVLFIVLIPCSGCQTLEILGLSGQDVVRRSGQVELFYIDYDTSRYDDATKDLDRKISPLPEGVLKGEGHVGQLRPAMAWDPPKRETLLGEDGESIRYPDDIVTVQVHGGFLFSLPWTLTKSTDIVLFAEVWENAAVGPGARSLNSIVYIGRAQMPEARMNFEGALAYGPTNFKGHPLKIKFTLMVLQSNRGEQMSNTTEVLQNLVSASGSASAAGILSSEAIGIVRQILRSQPDVEAFDFEATLISDEPEMLQQTLLGDSGNQNYIEHMLYDDIRKEAMQSVDRSVNLSDNSILTAFLLNLRNSAKLDSFSPYSFKLAFDSLQNIPDGSDWLLDHKIDYQMIDKSMLSIIDHLKESHGDRYDPSQHYKLLSNSGAISEPIRFASIPIIALSQEIEGYLANLYDEGTSEESTSRNYSLPRDRDAGPQRLNWLRYGTYALIETKPRRIEYGSEYIDASHFFWYRDYRVLGNSLASTIPDPSGSDHIRHARANYIIFSIVPRQLEQHQSSLRAAAEISNNLMQMLSVQSGKDPGELAETVTGTFTDSIDRDSLLHIGRQVARKYSGSDIIDMMQIQHDQYIAGIKDGGTRKESAERYAASIQRMWEWRVRRHDIMIPTESP